MTKRIELIDSSIYEMKELSKHLQNQIIELSKELQKVQIPINKELESTVIRINETYKKLDSIIENASIISDFAEHLKQIKRL